MKRFVVFSMLVACGGGTPAAKAPEKCPTQSITVSVLSSPTINRTSEGEARPVVVRIYQLKADARLYNASFEGVWKDDKNSLSEDLVSSQELEIYPGTRTDVKFERPPAVNHIAGVALFSNPTGRAWFASLDLPPVPEPGKCGNACPLGDEECENANVQAPHFIYYVDNNKIDDGVEHIDDYPQAGKMKAKR
jgi:type VI secretion system protein VasD